MWGVRRGFVSPGLGEGPPHWSPQAWPQMQDDLGCPVHSTQVTVLAKPPLLSQLKQPMTLIYRRGEISRNEVNWPRPETMMRLGLVTQVLYCIAVNEIITFIFQEHSEMLPQDRFPLGILRQRLANPETKIQVLGSSIFGKHSSSVGEVRQGREGRHKGEVSKQVPTMGVGFPTYWGTQGHCKTQFRVVPSERCESWGIDPPASFFIG